MSTEELDPLEKLDAEAQRWHDRWLTAITRLDTARAEQRG